MAFDDQYRLSAHAVITDANNRVLLLKATYGSQSWGLPGGALEPGETIHDCLHRECQEELGLSIHIEALTGVYYHSAYNSHVFIFRCRFVGAQDIRLSTEHSDSHYFPLEELSTVQRRRVEDCLGYAGSVVSRKF